MVPRTTKRLREKETTEQKLQETQQKLQENEREHESIMDQKATTSSDKKDKHDELRQNQEQRVDELNKETRLTVKKLTEDGNDQQEEKGKYKLEEASKDDIEVSNQKNVEMENVNIIANQQVYKLMAASIRTEIGKQDAIVGLSCAKLSLYDFDHISDKITNEPFSPFLVTEKIPQLFYFESTHSDNLQPNQDIMFVTNMIRDDANFDVVKESVKLWYPGTLTSRICLNSKLVITNIVNPNSIAPGAITVKPINAIAKFNVQNRISLMENRLFSLISIFTALDDVLVLMPRKLVQIQVPHSAGVIVHALSEMPIYSGMAPHFYMAALTNMTTDYRNNMDRLWSRCPLQIADMEVSNYAGAKLAQHNKTIIDQYTAAFLRTNYERMQNNQLAPHQLLLKIQACLIEGDSVMEKPGTVPHHLTIMYNYTDMEQNLFMFKFLTSPTMRTDIMNILRKQLALTNRLTSWRVEEIWKPTPNISQDSINYETAWMNILSVGDGLSPYDMLIYETFADGFEFRISPSPIPKGIPAMIEILSIYVHMVTYPRITQQIINVLGHRLSLLYQSSLGDTFTQFRRKYGAIRKNWMQTQDGDVMRLITPVESQTGTTYSIFYDKFNSKNGMLKTFEEFLSNMNSLIAPTTEQVSLSPKLQAGFPYMYDDYNSYVSWKPVDPVTYLSSETTAMGDKIQLMISNMQNYLDAYSVKSNSSKTIKREFLTYFKDWSNALSNIVLSCGSAFELTSGRLQRAIMNSPFYIGSLYDPTPERFWYVPKRLGISPVVNINAKATIIPNRIVVANYNYNIGIRHVLTMVGEFNRSYIVPLQSNNVYEVNSLVENPDITFLDGIKIMEYYYSILGRSKRFGYAMQLARWLVEKDNEYNPIKLVAEMFDPYMKLSTWALLVRKVFTAFDVNFDEYFIESAGTNTFTKDGRYLDKVLSIMNPITAVAEDEQPPNSWFGRKFEYVTEYDIYKFNSISRPIMSYNSRVLNVVSGWYFGKMIVNTMGPTQADLSRNWNDIADFSLPTTMFRQVTYNAGTAVVLDYISQVDQVPRSWMLPIAPENNYKLLIKMDSLTKISAIYTDAVASAIYYGYVIIYVDTFNIQVNLRDGDSLTRDYSEQQPSLDEVKSYVQSSVGTVFIREFLTTTYAANFTSNVHTIPGYIQWFATHKSADKNIFASTITNSSTGLAQSIMPSEDELGYGPSEDGTKFNDQTEKLSSDIINWNNRIYTISDRLMTTPEYQVIPVIPCQVEYENLQV